MNLLVVGSVAFDNIETRAGEGKRLLGGSATYFSLAAAPFCTSRIVAVVGEDFTPEYEVFASLINGTESVGLEQFLGL